MVGKSSSMYLISVWFLFALLSAPIIGFYWTTYCIVFWSGQPRSGHPWRKPCASLVWARLVWDPYSWDPSGLGTPGLGNPGVGTPSLGTHGLGTPGLWTLGASLVQALCEPNWSGDLCSVDPRPYFDSPCELKTFSRFVSSSPYYLVLDRGPAGLGPR